MPKTYSLRPHHINQLAEFMWFGELSTREKLIEDGYEENFIDFMFDYMKEVANVDEGILYVAPNLDDICLGDDICLVKCNQRKPSCENNDSVHYTEWFYPLYIKAGESYDLKLILDRIRKEMEGIDDDMKKSIIERQEESDKRMRELMKKHNIKL